VKRTADILYNRSSIIIQVTSHRFYQCLFRGKTYIWGRCGWYGVSWHTSHGQLGSGVQSSTSRCG